MLTFLFLASSWMIASLMAIRVISRRLAVGTSLAWLFILFSLPFLGIAAYLLFGESNIGNKRLAKGQEIRKFYREFSSKHLPSSSQPPELLQNRLTHIAKVASLKTGFYTQDGNELTLLDSPDTIFDAVLADIQMAKEYCLLEFYIVETSGRSEEVFEALCAATQRGVRCQILADAIGSSNFLKSDWAKKLQTSGVDVIGSLPVGVIKTFFKRNDLRNHRKIIVVDNLVAYTGSFNLVDPRFFKADAGVGEWVDIMVRCQGPVVRALSAVFYSDFAVESSKDICVKNMTYLANKVKDIEHYGDIFTQVIPSGPDQHRTTIIETLVSAFYSAKEEIIITTPYFVPDDAIMLALTNAVHRGVKVTIIVPEKVDSFLVHHAAASFYEDLLESGVKIANFHGGLLHSKTVTIDDDFCFVGTVNMDIRSFYLNLEVTLAVYNEEFVRKMIALQKDYLQHSEPILLHDWKQRSPFKRFLENTIRLTSPFL
ncbi:MAG: cardiolipin synthase [Alphaproteobacteria bacterium]